MPGLKTTQNRWGNALLKHCLHDGFRFQDNPKTLTIGFHCSCPFGKGQLWQTTLMQLKNMTTEVNALVQALRKAKLFHHKLNIPQDDNHLPESLKRLRNERRRLERQLEKRMSPVRRARLKEKFAHIDQLMVKAAAHNMMPAINAYVNSKGTLSYEMVHVINESV